MTHFAPREKRTSQPLASHGLVANYGEHSNGAALSSASKLAVYEYKVGRKKGIRCHIEQFPSGRCKGENPKPRIGIHVCKTCKKFVCSHLFIFAQQRCHRHARKS